MRNLASLDQETDANQGDLRLKSVEVHQSNLSKKEPRTENNSDESDAENEGDDGLLEKSLSPNQ